MDNLDGSTFVLSTSGEIPIPTDMKEEAVRYLRNTIIPGLRKHQPKFTAKDLQTYAGMYLENKIPGFSRQKYPATLLFIATEAMADTSTIDDRLRGALMGNDPAHGPMLAILEQEPIPMIVEPVVGSLASAVVEKCHRTITLFRTDGTTPWPPVPPRAIPKNNELVWDERMDPIEGAAHDMRVDAGNKKRAAFAKALIEAMMQKLHAEPELKVTDEWVSAFRKSMIIRQAVQGAVEHLLVVHAHELVPTCMAEAKTKIPAKRRSSTGHANAAESSQVNAVRGMIGSEIPNFLNSGTGSKSTLSLPHAEMMSREIFLHLLSDVHTSINNHCADVLAPGSGKGFHKGPRGKKK
jgi:hypothetical protein